MTTYQATGVLQTFTLTEAGDTVLLGGGNFFANTVISYSGGGLGVPSNEVVILGGGTEDAVTAYLGDTILGGPGNTSGPADSFWSAGGDNTYNLGAGEYVAHLAGGDTFETSGRAINYLTLAAGAGSVQLNLANAWSTLTLEGDDHVTYASSSANNFIYAYTSGNSITLQSGSALVYLGASDYLTVDDNLVNLNGEGSYETVKAGDGNDAIGVGSSSTLSAGNGNDVLGVGSYGTLIAGNGDDTISVGSHGTVFAGNGKNTITMSTWGTVIAGDGSNRIFANNDDYISLGGGQNYVINPGDDVIIIGGDGNTEVNDNVYGVFNWEVANRGQVVTLGNGDDSINLFGGATVHLGDGSDSVTLGPTSTLVAGNGNDYILTAYNFTADNSTVTVGNGNDTIWLSANDTLVAGNGDDNVYMEPGVSTGASITLGSGNDMVAATGDIGNYLVHTGSGNDFFNFSDSAGGSLYVDKPLSGSLDQFDLAGSRYDTVALTIQNVGDVLALGDAVIPHLTLNVAVDGFKLPDGNAVFNTSGTASPTAAVVNYIDTTQVINSAYAQAVPLPYFIADLLYSPAPHWNEMLGQSLTLNFSFMQSQPGYTAADHIPDATGDDFGLSGFQTLGPDLPAGLTPQQMLTESASGTLGVTLSTAEKQALTALAAWESKVDVTFVSATDSNSVAIRFGSDDQLLFNTDSADVIGYAGMPGPGTDAATGGAGETGDVFIASFLNSTNASLYADGTFTYLHEIGHVLGLGGESGSTDPYDLLPGGVIGDGGGEDTSGNTVMSFGGPIQSGPQVFDIAAAQYLYGADPNYNPNPSHIWGFNAKGGSANLIDGGGVNTIAAGGWSGAAYIDLRPGHWSWEGSASTDVLAANQLFNDYGTVVDAADVHLTTGAVTIVANDGDDAITSGTGNDLIVAGPGFDSIIGGIGNDTVLFAGAFADYTITDDGNNIYTITANSSLAGGTVHLTNIANLAFTDQTIVGFDAADLSDLTPSQVASLSTADIDSFAIDILNTLSATNAALLSTTQVRVLTSSQFAGLSMTVLDSLSASSFAALTAAHFAALTSTLISGLNASAIRAFSTTEIAALTISQIDAMSGTQLSELTTAQLGHLSPAAFAAFGTTALDEMSATQIGSLTTTQLAGLNLSALAGLSTDGIAALTTSVVASLSATQVGVLTATEFGALTASQLGGLKTADIVTLTTTQIGGLTQTQFGGFTATQVASISTSGIASLTASQIYGLSTAAIAGLTQSQVPDLSATVLMGLSANQLVALFSAQPGAITPSQYAAIQG